MKPMRVLPTLALALVLGACSIFPSSQQSALTASGTMAATDVNVAPEISGKVTEVDVSEGDTVKVGDVLFKLDCQMIDAQHDQTQASVDLANSSLDAANAQLENAQAQYNLTAQNVQQQNTPNRVKTWGTTVDSAFDLPSWYFQPDEVVTAAQAEVDAAQKALADENTNLQSELEKASNADFVAAEKRLDQAQVAYQVAKKTHDQSQSATNNNDLENASQDIYNAANNELQSAQVAYNNMLSTSSAQSVLEARAKVAAAVARLDNAKDQLASLQTGDQSLQLQAAAAGVKQAQAAVAQAQNNIAQATASLNLIKLQQDKCTVTAAIAGVISSRNLEAGEMAAAGGTVMVISQLNPVTLTVYVPEDRYGQVKLGQQVSITVDSFPGETFMGTVQYISSEAEFTPRDVQTVAGREATVYAVKINVPNDKLLLKSGMAADVTFK
jgi:HlyD family secretion protein